VEALKCNNRSQMSFGLRLAAASFLAFLITATSLVHAADAPAATAPTTRPARTGAFQIRFTQRSPLSDYSLFLKRFNVTRDQLGPDYKIQDQQFAVYVPNDYEKSKPLGILVCEVPDGMAEIDPSLQSIMDRHRLIMVGTQANHPVLGMGAGLSLDAVYNLEQRYAIDPSRIYLWGAGLWTEPIGWGTADIFRGDTYIWWIGWFRKTGTIPPIFKINPNPKMLQLAMTRPQVLAFKPNPSEAYYRKVVAAAMTDDGFEHVFVEQTPEAGDTAQWFDQMLKLMESAKPASASAAAPPDDALRLLHLAQAYISSGLPDRAREKLNLLIQKYPNDPSADKARQILSQLNSQ
jgi:hypothetical protein